MTTSNRPAQAIAWKRGPTDRAGSMSELATRQVVPGELRPFQVRRGRPGQAAAGPAALSGAAASARESGSLDRPATPPVRGEVVSRRPLFGRLAEAERVVQISAPAGSGKTVLIRSWLAEAGLARYAAWVAVDGEQQDPQEFWISVAGALRGTPAGSALVRPLTAAPDLDGWSVVDRLLKDLAPLQDRLWLVVDDVQGLGSAEARRQLELLL